jgi:hypothetical protein
MNFSHTADYESSTGFNGGLNTKGALTMKTTIGTTGKLQDVRGRWALTVMVMLVLLAQDLYGETLQGRVTECATTAGARAHVVKGFEETTIGLPDLGRPCTIVTDSRQVGVVTTGANGSYSITYQPTEHEPDFCLFARMVFVQVFLPDGTTLIHTSAKTRGATTNTFDDFDTGVSNNCPVPRFGLSLEGPPVVSGQPGEVVAFDVSVLLNTSFVIANPCVRGQPCRAGLHGAEGWAVTLAAQGGTIQKVTTDATLAAEVDEDPPGLRPACGFAATGVVPVPACENLTVGRSTISLYCIDGSQRTGLPLGSPARILRATIEGMIGIGETEHVVRLFFPQSAQEVGCPLPGGSSAFYGAETYDIPARGELQVTIRSQDPGANDFRRGDTNASGGVDISDASAIFNYLFLGGKAPSCRDAADSNADGDLDISDGVNTLTYLFLGEREIPPPGPSACGSRAEEQPPLGCDSYESCG